MTQIPPRNVMFIIIDQMRADLLHGALADHVPLPNLRALMGAAVSFTNHHSVANPCGPSRASLLTGQYAMNHRSVRNGAPLRHDTSNLATEVRKGGHLQSGRCLRGGWCHQRRRRVRQFRRNRQSRQFYRFRLRLGLQRLRDPGRNPNAVLLHGKV